MLSFFNFYLIFNKNISRTSAVSSTNFGSLLIFGHAWYFLFFSTMVVGVSIRIAPRGEFSGIVPLSRVTWACPVTTESIMRVDVRRSPWTKNRCGISQGNRCRKTS